MMLGDTDREPSADLQQLDNLSADNPVFNPVEDGAELAEPFEPAEQQRGGTVFAVFPEVLAFGRMPKAAYSFYTFLNVLGLRLRDAIFLGKRYRLHGSVGAALACRCMCGRGQPALSARCELAPPRGGTCGRTRGARHQRNGAE